MSIKQLVSDALQIHRNKDILKTYYLQRNVIDFLGLKGFHIKLECTQTTAALLSDRLTLSKYDTYIKFMFRYGEQDTATLTDVGL